MLTVHHLGVSQSDRIVWLCEELAIPYNLVLYDRDPKSGMAPADYRALHPFGTAPVITDGTLVLGESAAIIDYIVAKYGNGQLSVGFGDPGFTNYLFWYHFANGSLMPSALVDLIVARFGTAIDAQAIAALQARSTRAYEMIEARLGEAPYFAGDDFSAADIMMVFPLTTMRMFAPRDIAPFPNLRAYLQRIGTRPAYIRAMEKADPGKPLNLS
ncbi:glutathione S-transferase family protein (plasmid) [Sphingomonas paeninsulae]|uniref:glutathione transferase n=1 Tax=Sphingomonas paeninsulae TaxID=2319844 RepID=A0A494T767_SPHPE|nr:glutathione S-transferase family protein [Sphingomonas paeninsulae]AYJ85177.1 glutathione S-transferase family protein [Sphingomonas paeninsulae]